MGSTDAGVESERRRRDDRSGEGGRGRGHDHRRERDLSRHRSSERRDEGRSKRQRDDEPQRGRDKHRRRAWPSRSRSRSPVEEPRRHHRDNRDVYGRKHDDAKDRHRDERDRRGGRNKRDGRARDHDRDQHSSKEGPKHLSVKQRGPLPDQADSFALVQHGGYAGEAAAGSKEAAEKEKPNYGTTGVLAAASNAVMQADGSAIVLRYHEPPEARKPPARDKWTLFVFKDGASSDGVLDTLDLGARSCWLIGRDAAVVDLLAAHPSVSKQHAVLQFRHLEKRNEFGDRIGRVRPYVLDLASANGTRLNNEAVPAERFVELRDKDLLQFGHSTREYVLMLSRERE